MAVKVVNPLSRKPAPYEDNIQVFRQNITMKMLKQKTFTFQRAEKEVRFYLCPCLSSSLEDDDDHFEAQLENECVNFKFLFLSLCTLASASARVISNHSLE